MSPTTTEVMANPLLDATLAFAGDYGGQWNNGAFGSTGAIETTIEVAETVTVTMDLGGFVFGGDDPAPSVTVMDVTMAPPYQTTNQLLGDATVDFAADGTMTLIARAVPDLGGPTLIIKGKPDPTGFQMTYRIEDSVGSGFAEGTLEMVLTG